MPPVNDDFANADDLGSGASGSASWSNVGATVETGEPDAGSYGDVTVWGKWTCPPGKVAVTFRTLGSINTTSDPGGVLDTVLFAYDASGGPAITDLVLIDSNDDAGDLTSEVTWPVTPGQQYYVKVDGYDSSKQGDIALSWDTEAAPPPPPPDCGSLVFNASTEFSIGNPLYPTVTTDDVVFFLNTDSFPPHLCSVPINPVGTLTDWGSWAGFPGAPLATRSQLVWISNAGSLATSNTIELTVAPFSDPTDQSVAFSYTESGVNTLFGYYLAIDVDGEHVIATIMKGFTPGTTITTEVWRIDLSDGSHEVLYTSSYSGSPDDSDLAVIGTNDGLEVTPDGYIWAGTATGKYFRLAPDGSSSDVWGGFFGSGDATVIAIARLCQPDVVIAVDARYTVTIDGVPQRQYVDTASDQSSTVRTCAPYMNASAGVPLRTLGRSPDYKRAVWFQVRRDDSTRELWTFTCPLLGGWNAGLGVQPRTTGWTVTT